MQSTAKARKKKENARSLNTNKNNSMIPMKKPKRLKKDMENDIRSAVCERAFNVSIFFKQFLYHTLLRKIMINIS